MKHGQLCAIAHNLAASVMSGVGQMIGGSIWVDFLSGKVIRGEASEDFTKAIARSSKALPDFYRRHGGALQQFREMVASLTTWAGKPRVIVWVSDQRGHRSRTEYEGWSLDRVRVLDPKGRVRRMPQRTSRLT